ncbi:UPF0676 protein C1494.01-like [Limulus polyphemus]|uniref:UPF0676 protein C1494.01-like n=1 Tax=Limulus polyphemus TaxID=6850 RepID=A0ABM1TB56_LIMPO|nr:UPF0676 protein C1494.01-like [Limulus polyphemus]
MDHHLYMVCLQRFRHLHPDVTHEVKETFAVTNADSCFPSEEHAPGLRQACLEFLPAILTLTNRFLKILAITLDVEEDFFLKRHKNRQNEKEGLLKLMYYPPVEEDVRDPHVVRFGEHTDFGTITFLFQDNSGGMEVRQQIYIFYRFYIYFFVYIEVD